MSGTLLLLIDVLFALALAAILLGLYAARRSLIARQSRRLLLFVILVVSCMAFLFLFKYAPHWYYGIFLHIGAGDVGLPLGLSYFFFRLVHVVMEWYRGLLADLSLRQFLCFAIFFPTVPAGPIETVDSFNDKRLDGLTLSVVSEAVWRILLGLFKKTFVVGLLLGSLLFRPGDGLMDSVLADPGAAPQTKVWLSLVLCLLYAYLDLSAYTDIAIGTGLLFGYRIRENFKRPLLSRNIAEFWQRYHISLGEWCRRHVYFPVLMISRNTSLAILLTMMTMGMWHHVNLNWGLWAVHHGVGIMWIMLLGRWGPKSKPAFMKSRVVQWVWTPVAIGLTVLWVAGCIALVFIEDIETALRLYVRFFTLM